MRFLFLIWWKIGITNLDPTKSNFVQIFDVFLENDLTIQKKEDLPNGTRVVVKPSPLRNWN